jgi:hypothetical protein
MELLKYRGLSEEKVEFIYGSLEKNAKGEYFIQEEVADHKFLITKRVIKESISWSTGVKDINKKESYLGDIVKDKVYEYSSKKDKEKRENSFGVVKKEQNSNNLYLEWNFKRKYQGEYYWDTNILPITHITGYEIVGNIYTNPDMIKKEG